MNKYELLLILPGTLDEKEAETTSGALLGLVKERGEDVEINGLGKNRLAYPIKQIRYGYFYTITFSAERAQVSLLQEKLRLHREVLRYMISHFTVTLSHEQKAAYAQGGVAQAATIVEQEIEKATEQAVVEEKIDRKVTPPKEEKKVDMDEVKRKLDKILEETDVIPGI